MRYLLIGLLRLYRFLISPLYGQVCRYHPSCSAYALQAVTDHGSARGSWLALRPLLRRPPRAAGCSATPGRLAATTPCPPLRGCPPPPPKEPGPCMPSAPSATSSSRRCTTSS